MVPWLQKGVNTGCRGEGRLPDRVRGPGLGPLSSWARHVVPAVGSLGRESHRSLTFWCTYHTVALKYPEQGQGSHPEQVPIQQPEEGECFPDPSTRSLVPNPFLEEGSDPIPAVGVHTPAASADCRPPLGSPGMEGCDRARRSPGGGAGSVGGPPSFQLQLSDDSGTLHSREGLEGGCHAGSADPSSAELCVNAQKGLRSSGAKQVCLGHPPTAAGWQSPAPCAGVLAVIPAMAPSLPRAPESLPPRVSEVSLGLPEPSICRQGAGGKEIYKAPSTALAWGLRSHRALSCASCAPGIFSGVSSFRLLVYITWDSQSSDRSGGTVATISSRQPRCMLSMPRSSPVRLWTLLCVLFSKNRNIF